MVTRRAIRKCVPISTTSSAKLRSSGKLETLITQFMRPDQIKVAKEHVSRPWAAFNSTVFVE